MSVTVPCFDCIDQTNPYDPTKWAYTALTPPNSQAANNLSCGTGGDFNLGVVVNKCESTNTPPQPPLSVNGIPYKLFLQDCEYGSGCQGPTFNIPPCANPSSDHSYGVCSILGGDAHYWWVRDWDTELANPLTQLGCCITPEYPASGSRTDSCPPNLWAGSSRCANLMQSFCDWQTWPMEISSSGNAPPSSGNAPPSSGNAPPSSGNAPPSSGCDTFLTQRFANGPDVTGAANQTFLNALSDWSSAMSSTGPDPADPFIPYVIKWCSGQGSPYGPQGMCNNFLYQACSQVTKDDIANDSTGNLGKVCGCFLSSYQNILPGIIPPECSSLCSIQSSIGGIPLFEFNSQGTPNLKVCQQTSCVIDNATVNMINSSGTTVSFEQVCGGCPSGGCTCIMDGVDEQIINSQINGIDISQNCGSCSSQNNGSCPPSPPVPSPPSSIWARAIPWIAIGILVAMVVLIFFMGVFR